MKIKRVEIQGFKSFVDRVALDFESGITAILGPNGCGKSNIVDAIRWAMGEQNAKNLRGRAMEDVIFGGSESRRPLGMAEVSMIFVNDDGQAPAAYRQYAEIMVTRRLFRNGDSEYLINKIPCRLLDISELFMDTGIGARAYSIIEQGKIGMILNAKPEDRRFLIEEAAGVTKYKSRKKAALRKIEATRQNLLRLGDIVAEVRRQTASLKRQAQKAERFRTLREELKGIEVELARRRFAELGVAIETSGARDGEERRKLATLATRLERDEQTLDEARLAQGEEERVVARLQEQVFLLAAELEKVAGRLSLAAREGESLARRREQWHAEEEEVTRRLSEADGEEERLRQTREDLGGDLERESRHLAEGEVALAELAQRDEDLEAAQQETRQLLYRLLTELSQLSAGQQEVERRRRQLEERKSRQRGETVRLREQFGEAESLIAEMATSLAALRAAHEALGAEQERLRDAVARLREEREENESVLARHREELGRNRSRLLSLRQLEQDLEGYGGGVKALLAHAEWRDCFSGVVADHLEAPAHLETALEAVLGERLQALVVPDRATAVAAAAFLGGRDGRATFHWPGWQAASAVIPAGARPLAELVRPRPGSEPLVHALLAGCGQVPSLEPYSGESLPAGTLLVTEAGELLSWRGEFTGGGRQGLGQGLLHKKREMKELAVRVESQEECLSALEGEREHLREALRESEERLREVDGARHGQALKVKDSEKDLQRLEETRARLDERLEVLVLEDEQLHGEERELDRRLEETLNARGDLEGQRLEHEDALARIQEETQILRREIAVVRDRVTALKVAVAGLREREDGHRAEVARLARLRRDLQGRRTLIAEHCREAQAEEARLEGESARLKIEQEVLTKRHGEDHARLAEVRERFALTQEKLEERQESLRRLREEIDTLREAHGAGQLRLRELALEAEHLHATVLERYRVDLRDDALPAAEFDADSAQGRLEDLRQAIDGIGEVNLTAIEEYRELDERGRFLQEQQEDLRQSLEGLQTAIGKINRTTRKRFRETFDLVNDKFREIFPRLFRGGQGELRLTDESDLLETGIEIIVQPPGKKLQNVSLLSGGEKALTAVALIFSIFLIKPSPFCMLDEVDAPLDDANIGRFNEMIKEMSQVSQFIIITHSKRTMEVADTLYGVTMEEPGVSKLVSVRFHEFEEAYGL
ncbi:chromosome segregation protein SMC [Trichloromonas sp.]|uniref:chromosome segregation protein SMC n=1 Tax=Trichloromonas sp. TaxID=3069249 RepID=UPI002A435CAC|nr:chromosome segregation protein SMC [Trichloromonas sp.]